MEHHRLEELGYNLACAMQAGTATALNLAAAAMAMPRLVLGATFGEPRRECDCGGGHRDRCCYVPPNYGC
jgi:hypothetical protein